jgi:hypothetical protein
MLGWTNPLQAAFFGLVRSMTCTEYCPRSALVMRNKARKMERWVNLGESLLAMPRPATAYVSQMAHPAIQILPPAKTKSKPRDVLVSILSEDTSIVEMAGILGS